MKNVVAQYEAIKKYGSAILNSHKSSRLNCGLNLMDVGFVGSLGAAFSPLDIPNLKLWLDADDAGTITKDASDFVSQWDDKSGEGNDVSQATGSKQPKWIDNVQNSKPIIRFDAIDDFLNRTTFVNGALTQPNTVFVVCKMPDTTTATNGFVFDGNTTRHLFTHNDILGASDYDIFAGVELKPPTTVDTTNILLYTIHFNTTAGSLRKSKSQISSGNVGTNTFNGIVLAVPITLADSFSNPDIAELLVYNKSLTTTERDDVETYLTDKWAV